MVEQIHTVDEAARMLRVSKHTIRAWFFQGRLKGIKLGRRLLFSEESIQELIDQGKRDRFIGSSRKS